jgi:hypothetical protein
MLKKLLLASLVFLILQNAQAQEKPTISEADRIRVAEAFRLGDAIGDKIWKDWSKAPFAVLLITDEHEFLVRHTQPSSDFALIGYDSLLKSNVYFRKRVFQKNLLATFPAVGGVSTIVIGQAENTSAKTSTPWVVTLLHEHFHQLQDSRPEMNAAVEALNLARGDKTGMWMLNYAFPYESAAVVQQVSALSKLLAEAIESGEPEFAATLAAYVQAQKELENTLSADDYKYFSFQLWKEGIARYTEYHVARLAATSYKPSKLFRALPDYTPFEVTADSLLKNIVGELRALPLANYKRVAFYSLGAGEGLLLDRANPNWRRRYFTDKFVLDKYFSPGQRARRPNKPREPAGR